MKISRQIIIALMLFLSAGASFAQSGMTDQQILKFFTEEKERGTSRADITKKLMQKGVSVDQLRRIRAKYEKEQKTLEKKSAVTDAQTDAYLREKNGEERENPAFARRDVVSREFSDELTRMGFRDTLELMYREPHSRLQVFGRDIFRSKTLTFESDMNIATPSDYRLGPGDKVNVNIWGDAVKEQNCTVTPDGDISIDEVGLINIGGLTMAQAQARVKNTLAGRFANSHIKLTLGQTKTITVSVFGEVMNPGTFTLSAFASVFHALYMAGGPNSIGTLRNIKVLRDGKLLSTIDLYDFILNGKSMNLRLHTDDVIYVDSYDCLVQVQGKVKRPMFYEMKTNESVSTLIKYAGGFAGDAYEDNVRLIRKKGGQLSVYSLDEFERGTFQLADADSLYVDSVLQRYANMVEIKGAVAHPGKYQMDGGITTVRALIERAGGLLSDAFGVHAVLHRRKENRRLEVVSLDAEGLMKHEVADIALRNEDVLFIPTLEDYHKELTLTITGEVLYPGTYDFAENTTIEDLILQAGGLTDAACMVKVDVSRRLRDQYASTSSDATSEVFSFALRDGFVVDGERGFVLKPFDEIYVRKSPGYSEQQHVTITGEILFSGKYALTKKDMRLSEVVKMAGGVTDHAYAHGARLMRRLTKEEVDEQKGIMQAFLNNSLDMDNNLDKLQDKLMIASKRSVGIELDKALKYPGDDRWDIVLREGDELYIPGEIGTVSITGEVMYPNTVSYNSNMRANEYIDMAGGYSLKAKKSRVFAINPNGTVSRVSYHSRIEPGATIIIPAKRLKEQMSTAQIISLTMSLVSVSAVLTSAFR